MTDEREQRQSDERLGAAAGDRRVTWTHRVGGIQMDIVREQSVAGYRLHVLRNGQIVETRIAADEQAAAAIEESWRVQYDPGQATRGSR